MQVDDSTHPACRLRWKWEDVRFVPAAILLFAGSAKAWNAQFFVVSGGMLDSPLLLLAVIFLEVSLGVTIGLGTGLLSWRACILFYSVLACFAFYAFVGGVSCNCFGPRLGAWFSFPIDCLILIGSWLFRPRPGHRCNAFPVRRLCVIAAAASSLMVIIGVIRMFNPAYSETLRYISADELIGKSWPLADTAQPKLARLLEGNWLVILIREDCAHCHELVAKYFEDPQRHRAGERTVALVSSNGIWHIHWDRVAFGDSFDHIDWNGLEPAFASPAVFFLNSGNVEAGADGSKAQELLSEVLEQGGNPRF